MKVLTEDEVIHALDRLNRRWPKTLCLHMMGGYSLSVLRCDDNGHILLGEDGELDVIAGYGKINCDNSA